MRKKAIKILFLLVIASAMIFSGNALAVNENYLVEISPEIPTPGVEVRANLVSYSFDVDRAYIVWSLDGVVKLEGVGEKKFSFMAGSIGKRITLDVAIITEKGLKLNKVIKIIPAEVDLLWTAKTYTPVFYKGKAMPVPGSLVTVAAIPHFGGYAGGNRADYIYNWKLDYKNKPNYSGVGKSSFTFRTAGPFNKSVVSVEVSDYKKTVKAKNFAFIKNREPELFFYKDYPLEGPSYNIAVGGAIDLPAGASEISVRGEPYFFSIPRKESLFSFNWAVNGKKTTVERPNVIDFSAEPGSGGGQASVWLDIKNKFKDFQSAGGGFRVNF